MKIPLPYFIVCTILLTGLVMNQAAAQIISSPDSSFTETVKGITFKMIKIPQRGYYAAQSEVTQELWQAITGENPSQYQRCPQCPVESVSHDDISKKFLPKLNAFTQKKYRLPTYQEWFFSALGGERYSSAPKDDINDISWNYNNSNLTPQKVMQKRPNGYGLYDMLGNVEEWTNEEREGFEKRLVYLLVGGDWSLQSFRLDERWVWMLPPYEENEGAGLRLFLTVE